MSKAIAIIAGAGSGTGSAVARRFAQVYPVVLLSRSQGSLDPLLKEIRESGGSATGFPTDVTNASSMNATIDQIKAKFGSDITVAAAIYNVASKFLMKPFLEQSPEDFFGSLEPSNRGAFNFAQATLPLMLNGDKGQYPPTLIFTGATAALKGGSGLSAFAMSKFGTRALSQSLAREFGPKGVHVSHAIIDGIINTMKTKGYGQDIPDAKIDPEGIADSYWFLHTQPRSAFTQEIDLRPYVEKW
ncbi:oxidoreductase [Penicillium odoratum]|uniref:oxidoreductase n=1 Tax=Penicillium odoratum TaxID=1167516 RepID=UPI0025499C27|nr:oxidoreductase [Penicillium odoratum]KAJ5758385.1 oxidoreductase [Penicillium odoratum]